MDFFGLLHYSYLKDMYNRYTIQTKVGYCFQTCVTICLGFVLEIEKYLDVTGEQRIVRLWKMMLLVHPCT